MQQKPRVQTVKRAFLIGSVWLILTAADPEAYVIGVGAVGAATLLSVRLRPAGAPTIRLLGAVTLLPGFMWRSFLGGVDVARRAFDPRLPLAPGWFTIPARLPEGGARVILGGEFSLLPGTLVAGTRGGAYLVHVLDRNSDVVREITQGEDELVKALGGERP